jgi:hypothetical protein
MARQPEQIKMLQLRLEYISGICIRQCGPVGKSIVWIAGIIPIDKNHEYDTITQNVTQLQHYKLKPRDGCLKPPKVKFEKSVAGCGI